MRYLFGAYELDTAACELRRKGEAVMLSRRLFDVLVYLLENPGQVVKKFDLMEACWPDAEVTEASLSHAIMELRRALGDPADRPTYIETVRGRGFRLLPPVERREGGMAGPRSEAAEPSLVRLSSSAPEAPFVGRERLMAMLEGLIDQALGGRGGAALVGGERGSGKTRVLAELGARVRPRARLQVELRCHEREQTPLWPWAQLVAALVERARLEPPRDLPAELLSALPAPAAGPGAASWAALNKGEQFAAKEALVALLQRAAAPAGLVLLWDDLQWADETSLALLEHAGKNIHETRVALVCTYNSAEARRSPAAAALGALARLAPQRSALLRGLSHGEAATLLAAVFGRAVSPALLDSLVRKTGGNPQLLLASARPVSGPASIPASSLAALSGVAQVVERHIDLLAADTLGVLRTAAVLGDSFALSALAAVLGRPETSLLGALSEAIHAGILLETPGALGWYTFEHPIVRGSLYRRWAPADRALLHQAAAQALERIFGADNPLLWPSLAHHLLRTDDPALRTRGAEVSLRAAGSALERGEHATAAVLCRRALDASPPPALAASLWAALYEAHALSGASDEAARARAQAASLAGPEGAAALDEIDRKVALWGLHQVAAGPPLWAPRRSHFFLLLLLRSKNRRSSEPGCEPDI